MRLLILAALLGAAVWLVLRSLARPPGGARRVEGEGTPLVRCAVCGTFVPRDAAVAVRTDGAEKTCCGEACAARLKEGRGEGA